HFDSRPVQHILRHRLGGRYRRLRHVTEIHQPDDDAGTPAWLIPALRRAGTPEPRHFDSRPVQHILRDRLGCRYRLLRHVTEIHQPDDDAGTPAWLIPALQRAATPDPPHFDSRPVQHILRDRFGCRYRLLRHVTEIHQPDDAAGTPAW